MVPLARKNLFTEKVRFVISVGGVAFSVLLILVISGLYRGWNEMISAYIESIPTDLWVVQKGTSDMFHSASILPKSLKDEIKKIQGVREVDKLLGRQVAFDLRGKEVVIFLFGYDVEKKLGGPLRMVEGKREPSEGEIIIDRVFAKNNNLAISDQLNITGTNFKIVGISEGGNMVISQFCFARFSDVETVLKFQGFSNYFLVKVDRGVDINKVKEEIDSKFKETNTLTKTEFIKDNRRIVEESFLPIIYVLVVIALVIGIAIIGLTIYTATIEKSKEYGVLKAIGISNIKLYRIIFQQALWSGILGFILGVILTFGISKIITNFVPAFTTSFSPIMVLEVFGAALGISIIASYIPIRRIARIDPVMVFKS